MNDTTICFLKPGDLVGVAAPSARFDAGLLEKGVRCLKAQGFRVRVEQGIFGKKRYLAGADEARAAVVNTLFADPEVKGVIAARGGFGAMRMLPYLDWDLIRSHPTLYMGFSDGSALISALGKKAGLVAVHGPNLVSLAKAGQKTLDGFVRAVTGSLAIIEIPEGCCLVPGRARGRLAGGNLATLVHLVGTPFQPDFDGAILFIEDVGEPAYKIDRMLSQMRMAGMFDRIRGVVAGGFDDCANPEYIPEILEETFSPFGVPILTGLAAGHGDVNISLPMGLAVTLDAVKKKIDWGPARGQD